MPGIGRKWTPEDDMLLASQLLSGVSPQIIGQSIGRSINSIRTRVNDLGLPKIREVRCELGLKETRLDGKPKAAKARNGKFCGRVE